MNPLDMIFQSVSNMTGGLIHDLTTVIIGALTLSFIAMGIDLVVSVLSGASCKGPSSDSVYAANHELQKAKESGSSVAIDLANARYRSAVRKYGRLSGKEDDC